MIYKPSFANGRDYRLLHDGFFSFAVVRQFFKYWLYGSFPICYYCKKLRTRARATIPSIISTSATLITVDMMLTVLRLSSLFTQITESRRPTSARTMLQIAQTMRTPSCRVIFKNTGTRAASNSRLIISAARLSF